MARYPLLLLLAACFLGAVLPQPLTSPDGGAEPRSATPASLARDARDVYAAGAEEAARLRQHSDTTASAPANVRSGGRDAPPDSAQRSVHEALQVRVPRRVALPQRLRARGGMRRLQRARPNGGVDTTACRAVGARAAGGEAGGGGRAA
jgi:hypothetical protein